MALMQAGSIGLRGTQRHGRIARVSGYRLVGRRARHSVLGVALAVVFVGAASISLHPRAANRVRPAARGDLGSLPLAARGPISELLGRGSASYVVRDLRAANPAQGLHVAFSSRGVSVASAKATLGLRLSAYGYGDSLRPVAPVAPRVAVNRVTYAHGALTEWYANGPLGLEQGFTLASRPGAASGPLKLSLSLTGGVAARMRHGDVLFEGQGANLRYGGLVVTDARGHTLPSSLALVAGHIVIRVDDRGAAYPLRVDPFVQQAALSPSTFDGSFGFSSAVSGRTIVVGDPSYESSRGAAYVFEEPQSGWADAHETLKLTAADGKKDNFFGVSVAISGEQIVVGAPDDETTHYPKGAAYIFQTSTAWTTATLIAQLTVPDERENNGKMEETPEAEALGSSVAFSGTTLVVGAPGRQYDQGAAYVFSKPLEGWSHASSFNAKLHAPTFREGCPELGDSIALAGNTVVVGAPGSNYYEGSSCGSQLNGEAYVFVEPKGGWAGELDPTVTLTPSPSTLEDAFGTSVTISEDGDIVAVGAPGPWAMAHAVPGAAYVFQKPSSGGWTGAPVQQQLSHSGGVAGEEFGHAVALTPDASSLVIAAPFATGGGPKSAAYVYAEPAGGWSATPVQPERLGPPSGGPEKQGPPEDNGIGYSLAASDGTIVAAGEAAYVFGSGLSTSISSPANGATYTPGQAVSAAYTCTAPAAVTVTRCAGPVANGAPIDTGTLGIHSFIVEAEDSAGGKASSITVYRVASPTPETTPEATSTTAATPTTVVLTPAQKAAAEAAEKIRAEKETTEFFAWINAVLNSPEHALMGAKLLNEGGIPVSYKLVPEPGLIATTGSTVTWNKPTGSAAYVSSRRAKSIVVFKLSYRITKAGKVSFKIPLTSAGRKLIKQDMKAHRSLVVYWTVTFTPQANRPATKRFKVTFKPARAGHVKKHR
jgi:hypothetical protein